MSKHYRSPHDLIASLKGLLAPNPRRKPEEVLQEVVDQLQNGRGYLWIGLYLAANARERTGQTGPATVIPDVSGIPTYNRGFAETKSKLMQPIKVGTRLLGLIEVESDRIEVARSQECVLLQQVTELLARYLTTDQGKLLLRKVRQNSGTTQTKTEPHKHPQSEYPALRRAVAGKNSAR